MKLVSPIPINDMDNVSGPHISVVYIARWDGSVPIPSTQRQVSSSQRKIGPLTVSMAWVFWESLVLSRH